MSEPILTSLYWPVAKSKLFQGVYSLYSNTTNYMKTMVCGVAMNSLEIILILQPCPLRGCPWGKIFVREYRRALIPLLVGLHVNLCRVKLNDFDDQERSLSIAKTDFQVLILKFHACNMKQAFYPLHKLNIVRVWQNENTFIQFSFRFLVIQPCMCNQIIS